MLINKKLICMLEQWKGTGNMGIRRPQVKSKSFPPGAPRESKAATGVIPDEHQQKSSREKQEGG